MKSIRELVQRLRATPAVLGLVEFGSREINSEEPSGDYDIFVIVDKPPTEIKVLHFFVNGLPVDLNVRSIDEIAPGSIQGFDINLLDGRIIYDPKGLVAQRIDALREHITKPDLSNRAALRLRQRHRSYLEKVRHRQDIDETYCKIVLAYNLSELLQSYHLIYPMPDKVCPPGITGTIRQIRSDAPAVFRKIEAFLSTQDLKEQIALSEDFTEEILQPIGGLWAEDELIALGDSSTIDAGAKGRELYEYLLGEGFR